MSKLIRAQATPENRPESAQAIAAPQGGADPESITLEEIKAALREIAEHAGDPEAAAFADQTRRMLVFLWTLIDETRFHLAVKAKGDPDLTKTLKMLRQPLTVARKGGQAND